MNVSWNLPLRLLLLSIALFVPFCGLAHPSPAGSGAAGWSLPACPMAAPPDDGPVLTCTIFNDGVVKVKLDFLINSISAFDMWRRYEAGQLHEAEIHRHASWEFYLQEDDGNFREVSRLEWSRRVPRHPNYDFLVELLAIPADFIGDGACAIYYCAKGDYESAAYSAVAIVIPFANGAFLRGGKYLVRFGAKVQELTPPQIWKLNPGLRGELIEEIAVKTRYAPAGFMHMAEASRWWPIFDVVRDDLVVSIKSTTATKGFGSLIDNIKELKWLIDKGATNGETLISKASLDIYVPEGYDKALLNPVIEFGNQQQVSVFIFNF